MQYVEVDASQMYKELNTLFIQAALHEIKPTRCKYSIFTDLIMFLPISLANI